eukprot:1474793-Amphidinium_carterae.1
MAAALGVRPRKPLQPWRGQAVQEVLPFTKFENVIPALRWVKDRLHAGCHSTIIMYMLEYSYITSLSCPRNELKVAFY